MKVVLFCGGAGFHLPGQSEAVPKPMTTIGYRPILWHNMRYYAHCGMKNFILCLGFKGEFVKNYFLRYNEALSNDFVMSNGGLKLELKSTDIQDWHITFTDTGLTTNVAQRLRAVERYVHGDEIFCANYADNLTNAPLAEFIKDFTERDKIAAVVAVRPNYSFHVVSHRADGLVTNIEGLHDSDRWVNGGYFIFRRAIFDYLLPEEDLVDHTFPRLIEANQLVSYRYDGFWSALDTLRDLHDLQALHDGGSPPWAPWSWRPPRGRQPQPA